MNAIRQQLRREHPTEYEAGTIRVEPLDDALAGRVRPALYVLLAAVAFVLLAACANVANLLLARALTREREIAIRATLGATRRRLVRQLMTESILLSALGALGGIAVAAVAVKALIAIAPVSTPRLADVSIDMRVLAFTLATALATGGLFGLLPALRSSKVSRHALATESRSTIGGAGRARAALVVVDLALALVLLAGAGLMLRTTMSLLRVNPGFDPERLLTLQLSLVGKAYTDDSAVAAFQDRLLTSVRALPGVVTAALSGQVPMGGNGDQYGFHVKGRMKPNPADDPSIERYAVTPDYFRAMGIPLLAGRVFTPADAASTQPVMIVSVATARAVWGSDDPIGSVVRIGDHAEGPWRTVIGIAGDVTHADLTAPPTPAMYLPQSQNTDSFLVLTVKHAGIDTGPLVGSLRRSVAELDPAVPVYDIADMAGLLAKARAQQIFVMRLLAGFAVLALVLAAIGLYGVVSYTVARRTRELGVRLALGANAVDVLGLMLWSGSRLVGTGLVVGLALAAMVTRFLGTLVFGVSQTDPVTFGAAAVLLALVALAAHYAPIRRALRIDPAVALRQE